MATVSDSIKTNAQGPKKAAGDGLSVEQHSIPDQIAADRHLAAKAASTRKGFPVRRILSKAPGATP